MIWMSGTVSFSIFSCENKRRKGDVMKIRSPDGIVDG
jgi:hypothetical protein